MSHVVIVSLIWDIGKAWLTSGSLHCIAMDDVMKGLRPTAADACMHADLSSWDAHIVGRAVEL